MFKKRKLLFLQELSFLLIINLLRILNFNYQANKNLSKLFKFNILKKQDTILLKICKY